MQIYTFFPIPTNIYTYFHNSAYAVTVILQRFVKYNLIYIVNVELMMLFRKKIITFVANI